VRSEKTPTPTLCKGWGKIRNNAAGLLALLSVAAIAIGWWWIYPPAGLIVAGGLLLWDVERK